MSSLKNQSILLFFIFFNLFAISLSQNNYQNSGKRFKKEITTSFTFPSSKQETDESFSTKWRDIANRYSLDELTMARNKIFGFLNKNDKSENSNSNSFFDLMPVIAGQPTNAPDPLRVHSVLQEMLHLFKVPVPVKVERMDSPADVFPTQNSYSHQTLPTLFDSYEDFAQGSRQIFGDDPTEWRPIANQNSLIKFPGSSNFKPTIYPKKAHYDGSAKKSTVFSPIKINHGVKSTFFEQPTIVKSTFDSPIVKSPYDSSVKSTFVKPQDNPINEMYTKYMQEKNQNPNIEIIPSSEFFKMGLDTSSIAAVIRPPGMSDLELKAELAPVFSTEGSLKKLPPLYKAKLPTPPSVALNLKSLPSVKMTTKISQNPVQNLAKISQNHHEIVKESDIDAELAELIRVEMEQMQSDPIVDYEESQIVPKFVGNPAGVRKSDTIIKAIPNVKFHKPMPLPKGKKLAQKGSKDMPKYVLDLAKRLKNEKNVQGIVRVSRIVDGVPREYLYPVRG